MVRVDDHQAADGERAELESILQTVLELGVRIQMSGGYTARVRAAMQHVALALGVERAETWVSSGSVGLAVHRQGWSRTSVRTTPAFGVNFTELSQLSRLVKRSAGMSPAQFGAEVAAIAATERRYPTPLVLVMLGISCGSFAGIFGADPVGIALAAVGGSVGATVRHLMVHQHFKPFVYCLAAALVATSIVLSLGRWTDSPLTAATASILFLVPGVPLLNGTADLLTSNYLNGLVRLTRASIILLGATLGQALSLLIWGWA